jgi:hypothetical protein
LPNENPGKFAEKDRFQREISLLVEKSPWTREKKKAWQKTIGLFTANYLHELKGALLRQQMRALKINADIRELETVTEIRSKSSL